MGENYFLDRNRKNLRQLNMVLDELPSFCNIYFVGVASRTTPLTRLSYARDLKIFFTYLTNFEHKFLNKNNHDIQIADLNNIDSLMIERFVAYLISYDNENGVVRSNADRGLARKLSSVRSFFQFMFDKELISSNVVTKVKMPKIIKKEIIKLENDEVTELLKVSETLQGFTEHQQKYNERFIPRDNAMLSLFLGTGIRVSELVGLNVDDIDFKYNSFKVTRKGGGQSILYFSDEIKDALVKYMDLRDSFKLPESEKALWISIQGKRMGVRSVENLVKKYARISAPLKKISPHKLRSTYGTSLYNVTKDISVVAEVLGHKDVNTTKKYYASISENIRKDVADKVKLHKTDLENPTIN
ncbi:MAG: tyrosine-type recombinase/integrase [Clostridia bacterium]|nr:tyrosine-type recombinase/integrase [Clostridia bacterium]